MCLFYLYAHAKIEILLCSNKHETGLVPLNTIDMLLLLFYFLSVSIEVKTVLETSKRFQGAKRPTENDFQYFRMAWKALHRTIL